MSLAVALLMACAADVKPPTFTLDVGKEQLDYAKLEAIVKPVDVDTEDPVYGRFKHYRAFPLLPVLERVFGDKKSLAGKQLVIYSTDGYAVPVTGDILTEDGAYLAFRDREQPSWEPIGPRKTNPGPIYLVWTGAAHADMSTYPWPYAVARIEQVESLAVLYPRTVPKDTTAKRGHELFLHKCVKCHAVNRQGGTVGPDLNVPMNVTEYWTVDQIKAYVKNPATFRYGAMPANPDLTDEDLSALTYYFLAMKAQKQE